jgi:hypothetical protein
LAKASLRCRRRSLKRQKERSLDYLFPSPSQVKASPVNATTNTNNNTGNKNNGSATNSSPTSAASSSSSSASSSAATPPPSHLLKFKGDASLSTTDKFH